MENNMELPKRKNNRLMEYNYSQNGYYFITICTQDMAKILWDTTNPVGEDIILPQTQLSPWGKIVDDAIQNIPNIYEFISIDKYVVMPNHIHMILVIEHDDGGRILSSPTISTVIGQMKRFCSKQIGHSIWQKSFHDHVIRNKPEYLKIWEYIDTNPLKWELDRYYTDDTQ